MMENVIGIDIGGTNIRVGLLNRKLEIIKKVKAYTGDYKDAEKFLEKLKSMVEDVNIMNTSNVIGIVLPVPWIKNQETISDATNIPCLEGIYFKHILEYFPSYKVCFENDVNVIALLESDFNIIKKYHNIVYITVSTGIGSGMIIDGCIYHGSHGYAGEIGSMIVEKDHITGTLEELCSGSALNKESIRIYGEGASAGLLFEQYLLNNEKAIYAIQSWIECFTRGLSSVIQMFDPDVVVLGGPVILHNQWIVKELIQGTEEKVLGRLSQKIKIVVSRFGTDAGMIGAGYYAIKQSERKLEL